MDARLDAEGCMSIKRHRSDSQGDNVPSTSSDYYWDSYSNFAIHEEMLKDVPRTGTYRDAILGAKDKFEGKIVLDVGCGTGILSLFAAQAGAAKVYAIDYSDIVEEAKEVVRLNGYTNVVEVIKGKVEDIVLPVEKVDIIISEWMGYALLYEGMLQSVICARDRFLKADGVLFPSSSQLYLCAVEDEEYRSEKIDFWSNVWGFNMANFAVLSLQDPLVDTIVPDAIISSEACIQTLDLSTCTIEDTHVHSGFTLEINRLDHCHGVLVYWKVGFPGGEILSTAPQDPYTHWKQTILYLQRPLVLGEEDRQLSGSMHMVPNAQNPRDLDLTLTLQDITQCFRMR